MNNTTVTYWQLTARCTVGQIVCPFGILSSVLTIVALYRKLISEKAVFFVLMVIVSILDLFFCIVFIYVRCSPLSYTRGILKGLVFSASLTSDLCALALTIERYLVLCWPNQMKNLAPKTAQIMRAVGAISISLIGMTRMQYTLKDFRTIQPLSPGWEQIHTGLSLFSDVVLPFILIICMAFFSGKIIHVVVKRWRARKKIKPGTESGTRPTQSNVNRDGATAGMAAIEAPSRFRASQHQTVTTTIEGADSSKKANTKSKSDDVTGVVSLVLILDLFFILNQLGYCFATATDILGNICPDCALAHEMYLYSTFLSDSAEVLTRSLTFYFYVKFSSLLRKEFLAVIGKVKNALC